MQRELHPRGIWSTVFLQYPSGGTERMRVCNPDKPQKISDFEWLKLVKIIENDNQCSPFGEDYNILTMPTDRAALNRLFRKGYLGVDEVLYYHIREEILK